NCAEHGFAGIGFPQAGWPRTQHDSGCRSANAGRHRHHAELNAQHGPLGRDPQAAEAAGNLIPLTEIHHRTRQISLWDEILPSVGYGCASTENSTSRPNGDGEKPYMPSWTRNLNVSPFGAMRWGNSTLSSEPQHQYRDSRSQN